MSHTDNICPQNMPDFFHQDPLMILLEISVAKLSISQC